MFNRVDTLAGDFRANSPPMDLSDRRTYLLYFTGLCAAFQIAYVTLFVTPWLVGAVMSELGMPPFRAGLLVAIEYLAIAFAALASAPVIARLPPRGLAILGAALVLAGNIASLFPQSFVWLSAARTIAGIGGGLVMATGTALVAIAQIPDRTYGQVQMIGAVIGATTLFLCGYAVTAFGYRGIFALLATFCLLALPLLGFLPRTSIGSLTGSSSGANYRIPKLFGLGGATILAMLAYQTALGVGWGFIERQGTSLGISQAHLSLSFGIAALIGISGAGLATWINVRFGRSLPIAGGIGLFAVVLLSIFNTDSVPLFHLLFTMVEILWFFCLPFIFGVAASLDGQGRIAAAVSAAMLVGNALGPAIGGKVLDVWGLAGVGQFSFAACLSAMVLLVYVAGRTQSARSGAKN